jgi:hypothetical protein
MNRHLGIPLAILIGGMLACGLAAWRWIGEPLSTTGIDLLFGQVYLTRESAPVGAREHASNEILLGGLDPTEAVDARLVVLPQEVFFWGPAYPGFAQTRLSASELSGLLGAMEAGPAFVNSANGETLCIERSGAGGSNTAPCDDAVEWGETHEEVRLSALVRPGMSVLQLRFPDGRLGEVRMYVADNVLAYSAEELSELPVEGVIVGGSRLVEPLVARAAIPPVPVLWPEKTAEWANATAARRLGSRYRDAVGLLASLDTLRQVVGEVQQIRPVEGEGGNWSSAWMDSRSMQLLLWVKGGHGEGVVRMDGWECWEAEMMAQGRLVELTPEVICPES